ncbi:hypothetical protein [Roseisolibacter sp. H3M3-2]|uniref:hypothetical protein n=1 Tax=Roseisolibacter sp. H3M3-2 TaxID=3031323 RepID=UPI0023DA007D|nr:hypothetical protein [Roseisolibacter sp. H3M3-2]MDF1502487.1 hypothetical protein [Roseisolibacter sp. H3M3-2]
MPFIDPIVMAALAAALLALPTLLWRRGARGARLLGAAFAAFHGAGLVVMLAAHCADIIYNVALRNTSMTSGRPFAYDWRTYSLLLFGALLILLGRRVLRAALAGDRAEVLRATGLVLLICAPTIPVHAFFGVLTTAWSGATLAVTWFALREPVPAVALATA